MREFVISRFMPDGIEHQPEITRRRARLVILLTIATCGLIVPLIYPVALLGGGSLMSAHLVALGGLATLACPLLMKRAGRPEPAGHLMVGISLAVALAEAIWQPQLTPQVILWLPVIPLCAASMAGTAAGIGWGVAVLSTLIIINQLSGEPPAAPGVFGLDPQDWAVVTMQVLVTSVILIITRAEERAMIAATERLARARDEAIQASGAKSDFLAKMSHELRTPLNAIIGYSELLREDVADGLVGPDTDRDLARIERSGKHLLELINMVLDLSKVEAGRMEAHAESFSLAALCDEVVGTVKPMATPNNNQMVTDLPDADLTLVTDRRLVLQSLLNLLSNAMRFTHEGTVTLRIRIEADRVHFEVRDTGVGMSPTELKSAFEPFVQGQTSTAGAFSGTGLGLPLCQRFVALLGGTLEVESVVGEGSAFAFSIPCVAPRATPVEPEVRVAKLLPAGAQA